MSTTGRASKSIGAHDLSWRCAVIDLNVSSGVAFHSMVAATPCWRTDCLWPSAVSISASVSYTLDRIGAPLVRPTIRRWPFFGCESSCVMSPARRMNRSGVGVHSADTRAAFRSLS